MKAKKGGGENWNRENKWRSGMGNHEVGLGEPKAIGSSRAHQRERGMSEMEVG
jgi:hypothetical protein